MLISGGLVPLFLPPDTEEVKRQAHQPEDVADPAQDVLEPRFLLMRVELPAELHDLLAEGLELGRERRGLGCGYGLGGRGRIGDMPSCIWARRPVSRRARTGRASPTRPGHSTVWVSDRRAT